MNKFSLNAEERELLGKLSKNHLIFLTEVAEDFSLLVDIVNYFIDIEKNSFFKAKEINNETLAIDHAFSRGNIAGLTKFLHIIGGAKAELDRRNEKK